MNVLTPDAERVLRAVAYHEAGHAAVAVFFDRPLEFVEITPGDPEREGCCRHVLPADIEEECRAHEAREVDVRPEVMGCFAGRIAEQLAGVDLDDGSDLADAERAADLAFSVSASDDAAQALLDDLAEQTRALLGRPEVWAGVERLAAELLRARRARPPVPSAERRKTTSMARDTPRAPARSTTTSC